MGPLPRSRAETTPWSLTPRGHYKLTNEHVKISRYGKNGTTESVFRLRPSA